MSSALPSPEAVFETVRGLLHAMLREHVKLASGGLVDARGVSEVDLVMLHPQPHDLLPLLPPGTRIAEWDADYSLYEMSGFVRKVTLLATADEKLAMRGVKHREIELWLEATYPELAERARAVKRRGGSTEVAWCEVLGLKGNAEEVMLLRNVVSEAAARVALERKGRR